MTPRTRPAALLGLATTATLALAVLTPLPALGEDPGAAAARVEASYDGVRNILPPGSNGTATAADALALGGTTATASSPENFADQLELYDALITQAPASLDDNDLDTLFKDASLTPESVVSSITPRAGVLIERDPFGVPFITGDTFEDVEYGAGYAAVEDRMFLMDVLRHTGQARLAEFIGDSPGNVAMDAAQVRSAYYTPSEAAAQVEIAAKRAGAEGPRLISAVDAFITGINAAQDALCPTVLAPSCPGEYAALQKLPEDWTRADVVYVASLVGGIFGKGGGGEVRNAAWLQALTEEFGRREALRTYDDLRAENDPEAPVTTTVRTPYGDPSGLDPSKPGVALPDVDGPTAPGSGTLLGRSATPSATSASTSAQAPTAIDLPDGTQLSFALEPRGMSNAILVTGEKSTTGKPLAVIGPQTGYFAPQLLVEQALNGPGIQARGVAFAGTNLFVQLGRGVDYAWSATSASSDNVDTVVERLCNVDGSRATVTSTGYRVGKKCRPMKADTHSETTTPNATAPGPPKTYEFRVLRTRHGIVQQRATVDGTPVAIVSQRSTYGHEVDSVIGFGQLNDPGSVRDAASFQKAAGNIDFTFNWFYADDQDISYYSSGLLPIRSDKVEPDLPHWAGKRFGWKGWLDFEGHPRETNPDSGYFVSWNNKQAPGFSAADNTWSYGSVYRSLALEDRLAAATQGSNRVDLAAMTAVMADAATVDSRAAYTLPTLLKATRGDKKSAAARGLLRRWLRDGAHRLDQDRDGSYAHQSAIALFDTWWESGRASVAKDVLRGRLGGLVQQLPQGIDDHPRLGIGSAWNGIAWYGYVDKDLRNAFGEPVRGAYHRVYCGDGSKKRCRNAVANSLRKATARALAAQDVDRVGALTYDKHLDDIRSTAAGLVGVRPIDWQNRPTFQQIIEFTGHRAR